jgi:hypothetical protein
VKNFLLRETERLGKEANLLQPKDEEIPDSNAG